MAVTTNRLNRLETNLAHQRKSGRRSFDQVLEDYAKLCEWLEDHGFSDALAALEAGVMIPPEIERDLRSQAVYDPRHRAFARVEATLGSEKLPDDSDLKLLNETTSIRASLDSTCRCQVG